MCETDHPDSNEEVFEGGEHSQPRKQVQFRQVACALFPGETRLTEPASARIVDIEMTMPTSSRYTYRGCQMSLSKGFCLSSPSLSPGRFDDKFTRMREHVRDPGQLLALPNAALTNVFS